MLYEVITDRRRGIDQAPTVTAVPTAGAFIFGRLLQGFTNLGGIVIIMGKDQGRYPVV